MTDRLSAFGRIGYAYTDAKDRFAGYGAVIVKDPSPSQHSSKYKFGFGLQYPLSDSWGMRAEAERYRLGDAVGNKGDVDLFSVDILYRFGATQPAPPPVAKALPPPGAGTAAAARSSPGMRNPGRLSGRCRLPNY